MDKLIIGQEIYYHGIGYGLPVKIWKIYTRKKVKYVKTENGIEREYLKVLNNECDLYSDKNKINQKLSGSWMAEQIQ